MSTSRSNGLPSSAGIMTRKNAHSSNEANKFNAMSDDSLSPYLQRGYALNQSKQTNPSHNSSSTYNSHQQQSLLLQQASPSLRNTQNIQSSFLNLNYNNHTSQGSINGGNNVQSQQQQHRRNQTSAIETGVKNQQFIEYLNNAIHLTVVNAVSPKSQQKSLNYSQLELSQKVNQQHNPQQQLYQYCVSPPLANQSSSLSQQQQLNNQQKQGKNALTSTTSKSPQLQSKPIFLSPSHKQQPDSTSKIDFHHPHQQQQHQSVHQLHQLQLLNIQQQQHQQQQQQQQLEQHQLQYSQQQDKNSKSKIQSSKGGKDKNNTKLQLQNALKSSSLISNNDKFQQQVNAGNKQQQLADQQTSLERLKEQQLQNNKNKLSHLKRQALCVDQPMNPNKMKENSIIRALDQSNSPTQKPLSRLIQQNSQKSNHTLSLLQKNSSHFASNELIHNLSNNSPSNKNQKNKNKCESIGQKQLISSLGSQEPKSINNNCSESKRQSSDAKKHADHSNGYKKNINPNNRYGSSTTDSCQQKNINKTLNSNKIDDKLNKQHHPYQEVKKYFTLSSSTGIPQNDVLPQRHAASANHVTSNNTQTHNTIITQPSSNFPKQQQTLNNLTLSDYNNLLLSVRTQPRSNKSVAGHDFQLLFPMTTQARAASQESISSPSNLKKLLIQDNKNSQQTRTSKLFNSISKQNKDAHQKHSKNNQEFGQVENQEEEEGKKSLNKTNSVKENLLKQNKQQLTLFRNSQDIIDKDNESDISSCSSESLTFIQIKEKHNSNLNNNIQNGIQYVSSPLLRSSSSSREPNRRYDREYGEKKQELSMKIKEMLESRNNNNSSSNNNNNNNTTAGNNLNSSQEDYTSRTTFKSSVVMTGSNQNAITSSDYNNNHYYSLNSHNNYQINSKQANLNNNNTRVSQLLTQDSNNNSLSQYKNLRQNQQLNNHNLNNHHLPNAKQIDDTPNRIKQSSLLKNSNHCQNIITPSTCDEKRQPTHTSPLVSKFIISSSPKVVSLSPKPFLTTENDDDVRIVLEQEFKTESSQLDFRTDRTALLTDRNLICTESHFQQTNFEEEEQEELMEQKQENEEENLKGEHKNIPKLDGIMPSSSVRDNCQQNEKTLSMEISNKLEKRLLHLENEMSSVIKRCVNLETLNYQLSENIFKISNERDAILSENDQYRAKIEDLISTNRLQEDTISALLKRVKENNQGDLSLSQISRNKPEIANLNFHTENSTAEGSNNNGEEKMEMSNHSSYKQLSSKTKKEIGQYFSNLIQNSQSISNQLPQTFQGYLSQKSTGPLNEFKPQRNDYYIPNRHGIQPPTNK